MTQQISAPEIQNSEENIKSAMEDIALIKRVMNHEEINMRRLGWLFLVYGSATLAFLVLRNVLTFLMSRTASLQRVADMSILLSGLSYVVSIVLFVLFMRKRREIIKSENVSTMKLFDMWGVMLFAPTALGLILLPFMLAFPSWNAAFWNTVLSCMKYGAISICVFVTGHYINSRTMKIAAAVLFILFPVLFLLPFPSYSAADLNETVQAVQIYGYYNTKSSMISLLLPFVYIGMGIFSLRKQRGSAYGDE